MTTRSIGELKARVSSLEADVAELKAELEKIRPPGVEFTVEMDLEVAAIVEHAAGVAFEMEMRMEAWA